MNKRPAQRLLEIVWLLPLLAVSIGSRATAAPVAPLAVEGLLYSTMPSAAARM